MKSKKVISSLLAAAMTTSLLAGCGNSNNTPASSNNNTNADNAAADNSNTDNAAADNSNTDNAAADNSNADNAADAPETTPPAEAQTLKVAAFEGGYGADMWSEVVAAFEASHPGVTVELTIDKENRGCYQSCYESRRLSGCCTSGNGS